MKKNKTKIAVFFGGKISQHLVMIRKAAKKMGVNLDLVSYNRVCFDTEENKVKIRGNLGKWGDGGEWIEVSDYDVLFFRTTGKHWEEVDLVLKQTNDRQVIIDPIIKSGKPSMACKAYQMLALKEAGIEVPRSIYGSLWYLYEYMKINSNSQHEIFSSGESATQAQSRPKFMSSNLKINFPVIIKGSGGDRGTRVFKADNLEEMEKMVREL